MTEVFFYHLTRRPLGEVLPDLLQRTIERKWRALVRSVAPEHVEALNALLWTASRTAFLPHGSKADFPPTESGARLAARQPIWLTDGADNPNNAEVLFLVDGASAEPGAMTGFARVCDLFDGSDEAAVEAARRRWKSALGMVKANPAAGHKLIYWQQGERGWEKKLEAA